MNVEWPAEIEKYKPLLDKLSPKQQEVVYLRIVNNLSFRAIAKILNISVSSVHKRWKIGIKWLKKANAYFLV